MKLLVSPLRWLLVASLGLLPTKCLVSGLLAWRFSRVSDVSVEAELRAEQGTRADVLAQDQQFWGKMFNATESELKQFEEAVGGPGHAMRTVVGLQLVAGQAKHLDVAPAATALDPMVALLNGLYEDSKKRIVELSQREEKSKQSFADRVKTHNTHLASIEAEFRGHQHVPAALRANDTALKEHLLDEENYFMKYWGRVRERNRKQFHTFLKIQHGLMDRLKAMSSECQNAASQQASRGTRVVAPEVAALLQHRQRSKDLAIDALSFAHEALGELEIQRRELAEWD